MRKEITDQTKSGKRRKEVDNKNVTFRKALLRAINFISENTEIEVQRI